MARNYNNRVKAVKNILGFTTLLAALVMSFSAQAFEIPNPVAGHPLPWQLGFQLPATPVMQKLYDLHYVLLVMITCITLFVLALLGWVCFRYSEKRNPKPSKTTHNTLLEVFWTAIPAIMLVFIAIPTLRSLYYMDKTEHADMTLKVAGYQWYWNYEYPEYGIKYDSYIIDDDKLKPDQVRLLEVDNRVVVPVGKTVRVLTTGADVIHSWAMPSFGVKIDAMPGRLNETWFRADKEGVYRGQCSELCGVHHGFMPIVVEVVSQEKFDAWVKEMKSKYSYNPSPESVKAGS